MKDMKIVILPRNSDTVFVYYDIAGDVLPRILDEGSKIVLRVSNQNINNRFYEFDIKIDKSKASIKDHFYFNIQDKGLLRDNLIARLGYYKKSDKFRTIVSSNVINLPDTNFKLTSDIYSSF